MTRWIEEALHGDFRVKLEAAAILYEGKSAHQRIVVFDNRTFGRTLALDDIVQTTEADEFIYHEMLVHVPVLAHGAVRSVLIVGGGDGGALEELLKHQAIDRVAMVEIDAAVVEVSQRWLSSICGEAFADPRLELVIGDGVEFVANRDETFDLIIVDSTDPVGPSTALFTGAFYESCKRRLRPGGVLVTQSGVPFLQGEGLTHTAALLKPIFADVACYLTTVPTYTGGVMALGWASDDATLSALSVTTLAARYRTADIETRHYRPEVHMAAFVLPPYLRTQLDRPPLA
jgi:spermidine synthase